MAMGRRLFSFFIGLAACEGIGLGMYLLPHERVVQYSPVWLYYLHVYSVCRRIVVSPEPSWFRYVLGIWCLCTEGTQWYNNILGGGSARTKIYKNKSLETLQIIYYCLATDIAGRPR